MQLHSTPARLSTDPRPSLGAAAKAGAWLFVLWGILHIWVGYEGVHQYLTNGTPGLWNIVIGGSNAPRAAFVHTADAVTAFAQGQLLLNFCLDVGGLGVLGIVVAWLLLNRASWPAYFIGLFIIGIGDLAFLFALVTPGVIEFSLPTISGPIIWFLAVILTPFGMPPLRNRQIEGAPHGKP